MKKKILVIIPILLSITLLFLVSTKRNDVEIEINNKTNQDLSNFDINLFPDNIRYHIPLLIKNSTMKMSFDLPSDYEGQIKLEYKDENGIKKEEILVTYASRLRYKSKVNISKKNNKLYFEIIEKESIFF